MYAVDKGNVLQLVVVDYARVQVAGKESSPFQVWKGIRQGCPLSPWLFNIFIDRIVSEARNKFYGSVQLTTGDIEVLIVLSVVCNPGDLLHGRLTCCLEGHEAIVIMGIAVYYNSVW